MKVVKENIYLHFSYDIYVSFEFIDIYLMHSRKKSLNPETKILCNFLNMVWVYIMLGCYVQIEDLLSDFSPMDF